MPAPQPQTDANTFLDGVIIPVLRDLGMDSPAAEKLLMMTAAHESMGFRYRAQVGGPALSYFQIEPATLEDLYQNYLAYRPGRQAMLDIYLPAGMGRIDALEHDDRYACAAARLLYARVPDALPVVSDDMALAAYAKRYWNTDFGKATPEKYLDDFISYGPKPCPTGWA
ncbi:hypothetical protein [Kordiimonas aestuarii]|uniref:hypothetical protein n=1 Tax=Kordiimonas aestuarii TaxID=1005925 RepID=UPI0021CEC242|nr:hypothetical protein [Kordiimonas aestuarii]